MEKLRKEVVGRARVVEVNRREFGVRLLEAPRRPSVDDGNRIFWLRRNWDGPGNPTIGMEGELAFLSRPSFRLYKFAPKESEEA